MTTLLSVRRWPHFCRWADSHIFIHEQITTFLSVSIWSHFCLWEDNHTFMCEQITTFLSMSRWPHFVCQHMTEKFLFAESTLLSVSLAAWMCTGQTLQTNHRVWFSCRVQPATPFKSLPQSTACGANAPLASLGCEMGLGTDPGKWP